MMWIIDQMISHKQTTDADLQMLGAFQYVVHTQEIHTHVIKFKFLVVLYFGKIERLINKTPLTGEEAQCVFLATV